MILVDTSVWVAALRPGNPQARNEFDRLLGDDEVATTEFVLAEVLQGARSASDFDRLLDKFRAPHFYSANTVTWRKAARLSFELKSRGLTTPLSDLVIATVALEHDLAIFALDTHFQRVPGLRLHALEGA